MRAVARGVLTIAVVTKPALETIPIGVLPEITGGTKLIFGPDGNAPEWRKYLKVYPAQVNKFGLVK